MKQILISLSIIGVVGALVIGGTIANFHDEERVTDVEFEAGYINLELRDDYPPGEWLDGARHTWDSPYNWAPGERVAQILHLRNDGNIDAARLTIDTIATTTTNVARAEDAGVPDEIDMCTRIQITRMRIYVYGGTNLLENLLATTTDAGATVFSNSSVRAANVDGNEVLTLHELAGVVLDPLPGIPAEGKRSLDIEFTFDSTAGSGYMGDTVKAKFIFRLMQR